jgi:hypothetical protein
MSKIHGMAAGAAMAVSAVTLLMIAEPASAAPHRPAVNYCLSFEGGNDCSFTSYAQCRNAHRNSPVFRLWREGETLHWSSLIRRRAPQFADVARRNPPFDAGRRNSPRHFPSLGGAQQSISSRAYYDFCGACHRAALTRRPVGLQRRSWIWRVDTVTQTGKPPIAVQPAQNIPLNRRQPALFHSARLTLRSAAPSRPRGGMRWTRASKDERKRARPMKSWNPVRGRQARRSKLQGWWWHQACSEERTVSKPSRRKAGLFPVHLRSYSCAFLPGPQVTRHPAFLRPSSREAWRTQTWRTWRENAN